MKIATHNGFFHADDVFSLATLRLAGLVDEIVRTRDETLMASCDLRVDVGRTYDPDKLAFDHHQEGGAGERANGIPYASFGLIWKSYGNQVAGGDAVAARVDQRLVQLIDANDVGKQLFKPELPGVLPASIMRAISLFNPSSEDTPKLEDYDKGFSLAVDWAADLLRREIADATNWVASAAAVRAAINAAPDPRIIAFDRRLHWEEIIIGEAAAALVVVFPTERGDWAVQTVRQDMGSFANRQDLPASWAGKVDADLATETGVTDAVFAHTGRFLVTAHSKAGAMELAKRAVNA